MESEKKYKTGLALSGGGSKGFAHLGVLQALEENGIQPDIISGTSAGALAGVLYADGHSPLEIATFFKNREFKNFAEFSIPRAGLFKSTKLHSFLKKHLRAKNFEDLNIPLKTVATDIEKGKFEVFETGPLIPAIIASCSYPIVFVPVEIDGHHYVDGGLFKNFPVSILKKHCETLIGVNVTPLTQQIYKNSLLYIAERSFHYMSASNTMIDRTMCDILIESVRVSGYPMFSLDHIDEIYNIGYEIAKEKLRENEQLIIDKHHK